MSFSEILMKLAEKKALEGDVSMAYSLMSEVEKKDDNESLAEMLKNGKDKEEKNSKKAANELYQQAYDELFGDLVDSGMSEKEAERYLEKNDHLVHDKYVDIISGKIDMARMQEKDAFSSTLNSMINKYASEGKKGSYKDKIKSMDGFMKMDGKAFCFTNNAQAKKALAVAEQAANFLNWQVMKGDGCFKLMEAGMDKKSSVLKNLIRKYAGFDDYDVPESGTTIEEMYDEDPSENYEDKDNIITDGFYAGLKNMDNNPHVENSYEHTMWQMGFEAGKEISDHFKIISEK